MPFVPVLELSISWESATFVFKPVDELFLRFGKAAEEEGEDTLDTDNPPESMAGILCEMFLQGLVSWDGVEDKEGKPLECNEQNKAWFLTTDKLKIAGEYLAALEALEAKKEALAGQATSSMPSPTDSPRDEGDDGVPSE